MSEADNEDHESTMNEHIETTPERYMKSPITGTTYRVTEWKEKGDGKFVALEKEEAYQEAHDE